MGRGRCRWLAGRASKAGTRIVKLIYCIEDEPEIAELICVALRDRGHDVEVATTGKAAIDAFKLNRFDLATIDYQLPDMTGLDIARKFIAEAPDVPIVIVTASGLQYKVLLEGSGKQPLSTDMVTVHY